MTALYSGIVLFVLAFVLLLASAAQRRASGLPGGRIIYTDTRGWGPIEKPLYDQELGLVGRPDYLVEKGGQVIPVEVKSGRAPEAPYDAHIFQLAASCLLVERTYGRRPTHGIIHYAGRDFAVDYTPSLESALLDILAEIRRDEHRRDVHRSHEEVKRCRGCGFRPVCDERLD